MDNPVNDDFVKHNKDNSASPSGMGDKSVSHSPLDLGPGPAVNVPQPRQDRPPAAAAAMQAVRKADTSGRITAVKTFFTKLHSGAIAFLEQQITTWLKDNPDVVVKKTNVIMGEVQGKKTEPNIIITIWY